MNALLLKLLWSGCLHLPIGYISIQYDRLSSLTWHALTNENEWEFHSDWPEAVTQNSHGSFGLRMCLSFDLCLVILLWGHWPYKWVTCCLDLSLRMTTNRRGVTGENRKCNNSEKEIITIPNDKIKQILQALFSNLITFL